MHKLQRLSWVVVTLFASVASAESAAINDKAVDRMIDLNKKAFADIQNSRFDAARYRLEEALMVGETAGLEHDEITARTNVHLAAVSLTGFKNREQAVQQFMTALRINPGITLTIGLETPALKSVYLLARKQMGLPPTPDTNPAPAPAPPTPLSPGNADGGEVTEPAPEKTAVRGGASLAGIGDPDLPAHVRVPLYCPLPFEIPPGQDLVVRCLTRKQQKWSSATLYYRPEGATGDDYTAIAMVPSAKGWLVGIIPGNAISGKSLAYYVQAKIAGSREMFFLGRTDAPNSFIIKEGTGAGEEVVGSTAAPTRAVAPFEKSAQAKHGRRAGAIWISLGGGSGAAYHRRATVDSGAEAPSSTIAIPVRAGFSPAGLFQIEPEVGYQWNEKVSVSAMARYQYAPKDADGYVPHAGQRSILTSALAGFLRAQFAFLSHGNFQTRASAGVGFGTSFLATVKKECGDNSCTLGHSDTLHGGPVSLTGGIGAIYHLSSNLGVFVDVNEVATLPKLMALTEVNLGLTVTYNLEAPAMSRTQKGTGW